jgi:hypothetical protein
VPIVPIVPTSTTASQVASDASDRDGVFVNVESDEDGGIVSYADLRMREPTFERN